MNTTQQHRGMTRTNQQRRGTYRPNQQGGQVARTESASKISENYKAIATFLQGAGVTNQLRMALPAHMNASRMVRVALICIQKNYRLLECSPESLAKALVECSEYGLEPNGRDIHLVPFWNTSKNCYEITVIPDYKGLVKLMYRSGQVLQVMAQAVHANDRFDYKYGTNAYLTHVPADGDRGPIIGAWAMVSIKDGGEPFVYLSEAQIEPHRIASRGSDAPDSPWKKYPDAMYAKTALRVLAKFVPCSPELERAIQLEDERLTIDATNIQVLPSEPEDGEQSKTQRLADRVARGKQQAQPASDGPGNAGPVSDELGEEQAFEQDADAGADEGEPESVEQQNPLAELQAMLDETTSKAAVERIRNTQLKNADPSWHAEINRICDTRWNELNRRQSSTPDSN